MGWLPLVSLVLCSAWLAGCKPPASPAQPPAQETRARAERPSPAAPAAPVPTHTLSIDEAGSTTAAEQGDLIEIRLAEHPAAGGTWRLSRQSGNAQIEAQGEPALVEGKTGIQRVFRFRALGIGQLELTFALQTPRAPEPRQIVTFTLLIK